MSSLDTEVASSFLNIKWFFIITLCYFIVKHVSGTFSFIGDLILFSCYYILVLFSQVVINIENSKIICGSSQGIILSTFYSWILIFGGFLFMLMIFPGWNIPFSHSIGYSLSQFAGSDMLLRKVINPKIINFNQTGELNNGSTNTQKKLFDLYTNDPSYLINEIPLEVNTAGEWIFWKNDPLINPNFRNDLKSRDTLYNLLYIKESTSHFLWYLLIGILACLVNFNYILTSDCVKSLEQIDEEYAEQVESQDSVTSSINYDISGTAVA